MCMFLMWFQCILKQRETQSITQIHSSKDNQLQTKKITFLSDISLGTLTTHKLRTLVPQLEANTEKKEKTKNFNSIFGVLLALTCVMLCVGFSQPFVFFLTLQVFCLYVTISDFVIILVAKICILCFIGGPRSKLLVVTIYARLITNSLVQLIKQDQCWCRVWGIHRQRNMVEGI